MLAWTHAFSGFCLFLENVTNVHSYYVHCVIVAYKECAVLLSAAKHGKVNL